MKSMTLENFRCFRERQEARLAPLTLLVGENSTGKTSFLAMVRALRDLAFAERVPDFKRDPYDLGSFDEIAHFRGGRGGRAADFRGGFTLSGRRERTFSAVFARKGPGPVPFSVRVAEGRTWVELSLSTSSEGLIRFGTARGEWERECPSDFLGGAEDYIVPLSVCLEWGSRSKEWTPVGTSSAPAPEDLNRAKQVAGAMTGRWRRRRVFASAPVRSRPRRTYDPARPVPDPEGMYIPMLFADMNLRRPGEWSKLKDRLEGFGRKTGLFDEIVVRRLGRGAEPFQIQVRKLGRKVKGPRRNLIDVGYGVSQIVPVFTELLLAERKAVHLLQQPEVHLHPSAQAALGSLLCEIAGRNRQIIVETHSDYLLDRIRMDVRDGEGVLRPEDVSILFFERSDLDVTIHSLEVDGEGNLLNAPDSYGRFFMEEVSRSLWKRNETGAA